MIDRDRPTPPYLQLAGLIRDRIRSGELAPGQRLPSLTAIAAEYGVALITTQKAIQLLKDEHLIVAYAGYGTFVSEDVTPR